MALTHLVDTSVLTRLHREAVRAVIEPLADAGRVARAGITDLEVGYAARNVEEWHRLIDAVGAFTLIATEAAHVQRARHVQRALAARTHRGGKVPDLLVAAAAEAAGLTVVHYDSDFDLIAEATGQPCEWVVPAGSVD